ncbi:MAG: DUF3800 domain-containing protein [Bacteroidetes bacterium]|nr:DUF3800 domain-containing protein [Bacteroidota bacterium]
MKYFFDESGSFAVKNPGPHNMVGVVYPDVFEKRLRTFYDDFIDNLIPDEFEKGEPKGRLLLLESREKLFSFLNDNSWLRIGVCLTDSEYNSEYQVRQYRIEQVDIYEKQLLDPDFQNQSIELIDLQNKLINDINIKGGLSDVHVVKGLLLMHTLFSLLIGSLKYFTEETYDDDWETFFLCFDRQDKNIITRMEDWVNREFINLITVYNSKNPIELDPYWSERNHPVLRKYKDGQEDRLILNEMFKDKFLFEYSENSFQLQIVDWISNTLFKVFTKELPQKFLNMIDSNLIKYNDAKIHVVRFEGTDSLSLYNKYIEFIK